MFMSARSTPALTDRLASIARRVLDDRTAWRRELSLIGDAEHAQAERLRRDGELEMARYGWLRALYAYRAAAVLAAYDNDSDIRLRARMRTCSHELLLHSGLRREQAAISCFDEPPLEAEFVRSRAAAGRVPAIICISEESESKDELLSRVWTDVEGRQLSLLLVELKSILQAQRLRPANSGVPVEALLSSCTDYLVARSDVDEKRIGVYGRNLASTYATRLAAGDDRIAASVCDGGLWEYARTVMHLNAAGNSSEAPGQARNSGLRSRFARRITGPFLVVAGDEGICSLSEASALYDECRELSIKMTLKLSQTDRTPLGDFEDCAGITDYVFGWLARKLAIANE